MPKSRADNSAKVFVKANGWNIFPSCACMANTGRKLIIVVPMPVITAPETSWTAFKINASNCLPWALGVVLRWRTTFSMNTTPTSTITPMAIAIPLSATILASIPKSFMMINVVNTAKGSMVAITKEARRLSTRIRTTMIQMRISCISELSSVPIVSLINLVRS